MSRGKSLNVYIPRILGNVTRERLIDVFRYLDIGNVEFLDMHKKTNQNGYAYSFAFITLNLYDTKPAKDIRNVLLQNGETNLMYNLEKGLYWVVKSHVDKENRKNASSPTSVTSIQEKSFFTSIFTEEDKIEMSKEFDDIAREINFEMCM
jgi:hypothetical protein